LHVFCIKFFGKDDTGADAQQPKIRFLDDPPPAIKPSDAEAAGALVKRERQMIFSELSGIISKIEQAKDISNSMMLFSRNARVLEKASKLSSIIVDIQSYLVAIQAEYIALLNQRNDLEKKLREMENSLVC
jgi:hypothetical protein